MNKEKLRQLKSQLDDPSAHGAVAYTVAYCMEAIIEALLDEEMPFTNPKVNIYINPTADNWDIDTRVEIDGQLFRHHTYETDNDYLSRQYVVGLALEQLGRYVKGWAEKEKKMKPDPKAIRKFLDYFNSIVLSHALHAGEEKPDKDITGIYEWLQELSKENSDEH